MGAATSHGGASTGNAWLELALGLLAGIAVLGSGVFFVTVLEAPVAPPAAAAPLFVWTTTAAVIAFVLLRRDNAIGYGVAILTSLLVVVTVGLVGSGAYGPIGPDASPLGPLSYVALGLGLLVAIPLAWRRRSGEHAVARSSSPAE